MNRRQIVSMASAALLVAALVPASASAQSFQAGVKGGINVASISWSNQDPKPAISSRNGGIIGGYVAKDGKKMGLAVEVLYSQKGANLDFSSTGFINTAELKLDYVEIPVLVRFNIPNDKTVIHIYAGPVFAFSVKDEITNTFRTTTQTTPATVDDRRCRSQELGYRHRDRRAGRRAQVPGGRAVQLGSDERHQGSAAPASRRSRTSASARCSASASSKRHVFVHSRPCAGRVGPARGLFRCTP